MIASEALAGHRPPGRYDRGMRPLDLALHGLSLACCVALGAGFWELRQGAPPPSPISPAAAPAAVSRPDAELGRLSSGLESLRAEVVQLRQDRADLETRLAQARPSSGGPAGLGGSALVGQMAFDDPQVQARIQAIVEAKLTADRLEEEKLREERRQKVEEQLESRRVEGIAQQLRLDDTQKEALIKLLKEHRQKSETLRKEVREKKITLEEGRATLERTYAEMDAKIQTFMTAEQYKQFQEFSQPLRNWALRAAFSEDRPFRIRERERPLP